MKTLNRTPLHDSRIATISILAIVIAIFAALAARVLIALIALITHFCYSGQPGESPRTLGDRHSDRGWLRRGIDGALRLEGDPRPRNSRGDGKDPDRREPRSGSPGDSQAAFGGDLDRYGGPVRRRGPDHRDGRGAGLAGRPDHPLHGRRAKDSIGRGRGCRDDPRRSELP